MVFAHPQTLSMFVVKVCIINAYCRNIKLHNLHLSSRRIKSRQTFLQCLPRSVLIVYIHVYTSGLHLETLHRGAKVENRSIWGGEGDIIYTLCIYTRNMHLQRALRQYYYTHAHKRIAQLCVRMSINDIPDRDGHVHMYVHHENRSLIHSLALMRSAIKIILTTFRGARLRLGGQMPPTPHPPK